MLNTGGSIPLTYIMKKYKVNLFDSFSGDGCTIKSNLSLKEAQKLAEEKGKQMQIAYVLDENDKVVDKYGKY